MCGVCGWLCVISTMCIVCSHVIARHAEGGCCPCMSANREGKHGKDGESP